MISNDPVFQIVKSKFAKIMNETPTEISRLNGWSNYVFLVTTERSNKYVFKILCSDESDPFKWQQKALSELSFQVMPKPLFDDEKHRIESFIPNIEVPYQHFIRYPEHNLVMRSVGHYNSLKTVINQKPNLFLVMERSRDNIYHKIRTNIEKSSPEKQMLLKTQLHRIDRLLVVLDADYTFPELVLSHNDLYYENLLFDTTRNRFQPIDSEYTGFNPKGMDVLQFINEWMTCYNDNGAKISFAVEHYPSEAKASEMIRFYLFFLEHWSEFEGRADDEALLADVRSSEAFKAISEDEVRTIHDLFPYFGVLANIFWYFWALDIFEKEKMALDFVHFAEVKFQMIEYFVGLLGNARASQAFQAPLKQNSTTNQPIK